MNGIEIAKKALDLLINNGSLDSAKRLSNAMNKGNYLIGKLKLHWKKLVDMIV